MAIGAVIAVDVVSVGDGDCMVVIVAVLAVTVAVDFDVVVSCG